MAQKKTSQTKNSTAKRSSTPAKKQETAPKPIRREAGAIVCAIFGFMTLLAYFPNDGKFILLLTKLGKGLIGWGFWVLAPLLLAAAFTLWFHHGRPVKLRVICSLVCPVTVGAFYHVIACPKDYGFVKTLIPELWKDSLTIKNGGMIGGFFAVLFRYLFSKTGAVIILSLVLFFELYIITRQLVTKIIAKYEERPRIEYEPEPEPQEPERPRETRRERKAKKEEPVPVMEDVPMPPHAGETKNAPKTTKKFAYDVEVDDPILYEQKAKKTTLFNKKSNVQTPDQIVNPANIPAVEVTPREEIPTPGIEIVSRETADANITDTPASTPIRFKHTVPITPPAGVARPSGVTPPVTIVPAESVEFNPVKDDRPKAPVPLDVYETEKPAAPTVTAQNDITPDEPSPAYDPVSVPASASIKAEPAKPEDDGGEFVAPDDEALVRTEPEYRFPPITLLQANTVKNYGDGAAEQQNRERLETALSSFGINSKISNIVRGPSVTRYEMELEAGVRLNRLTTLSDDIALSMGASGVRIAPIPDKISTVGIEIPNKNISSVLLREIIESDKFTSAKSKLTFAIGKDISGDPIVGDISKLPHMLVAGTTGSGKSVCLNSLILSILYKAKPDEVKFIMVDPKMVEFKVYNGIPHLLVPVVTEAKKASGALQWAVVEMMKRYRLFSESGARDLTSYNSLCEKDPEAVKLPQIVVVIDELADLMMVAAKEVEESICRIAQMGRAAGVHLVIATQSPRADIITGLMKANIPSRIALKVASSLESRIILDAGGSAEKLVGNGDMLYVPVGTSKPIRIQGTWVTEQEREDILDFIKSNGRGEYDEEILSHMDKAAQEKGSSGKTAPEPAEEKEESQYDEKFNEAVEAILEANQASVSILQRRLKLGYARAARIVDQLEERGIVGPFEGSKPRQILITKQQWQEMQFVTGTAPVLEPGQTMTSVDDLFEYNDDPDEY